MELTRAKVIAVSRLLEHGLIQAGWVFKFDNARVRAGATNYRKKVVSLSRTLTLRGTDKEVIDTILHEVAHAILGPGHGHGPTWKKTATELGCSGQRTHNQIVRGHKYKGICPAGHEIKRFRKPKGLFSCAKCSPVFSTDHLFDWKKLR